VKRLAADGVIGPHLPRGANAGLIADRFAAAGVPAVHERPERTTRVLEVHREDTRRRYTLRLTFGASTHPQRAITFLESWLVPARREDDGDFDYHVRTPYESLRRFADILAFRTGASPTPRDAPDHVLEDAVEAGLRTLAERGELADSRPARSARDLVAALLVMAGAPAAVTATTSADPPPPGTLA
jgi:hypothetical protein